MDRTGYGEDKVIEEYLFVDCDLDLYSALQVTEILAMDFIEQADEDAEFYLAS